MLPFLQFILVLGIIIGAAKIGGLISYKLGQPSVVGEVITGLLLGPTVLDLLNWSLFTDPHLGETVANLAELGVLLLMFIAGINLHLQDLIRASRTSIPTGLIGFLLTLGLGCLLATQLTSDLHEALYIGLMLAPTSIGISAQTFMELKILRSKVGTALMGAVAIDDMLGVLGVSLFLSFFLGEADSGFSSAALVLLRMVLFLIFASVIGYWTLPKLIQTVDNLPISQGLIAFAFFSVLIFSWSAEALGSMSAIIGAFLAGLFFGQSPLKDKIESGFTPIAYAIFVPIFFINVGLSANIRQISLSGILILIAMILVVIVSKLAGAGLGGRLGGLTGRESVQLGVGMIPRGEVVLILATIGITEGLIGTDIFSEIVVLVIVTTLITPPILRSLLPGKLDTGEVL